MINKCIVAVLGLIFAHCFICLGQQTNLLNDPLKEISSFSQSGMKYSADSQEVCMVTVDTAMNKVMVIWEKPVSTTIDSFHIYKESLGSFVHIGSVDYNSLSMFTDPLTDPSIEPATYKISIVDNSGTEGPLTSSSHTTMHAYLDTTSSNIELNWTAYNGFPTNNYRIYVDRSGTGDNWELFDSISLPPNTDSSWAFNDPGWHVPSGLGCFYAMGLTDSVCKPELEHGDYIGAFYNGPTGYACAGFVKWDIALPHLNMSIYGDNPMTPHVDGLIEGDGIKLIIWKKSNGAIFDAVAATWDTTNTPDSNIFVCGGISTITSLSLLNPIPTEIAYGFMVQAVPPNGPCSATKSVDFDCSYSNIGRLETNQTLSLSLSSTDTHPDSCNGSATATATNGYPPYTYLWDDPLNQITSTAINLCAGTYTATVTDSSGHTESSSITISEQQINQTLSISLSSTSTHPDSCNGTATATATNGYPPYTYLWDDPLNQNTSSAINLCADTYTITITDSSGNSVSESVTINNLQPTNLQNPSNRHRIMIHPNPTTGIITFSNPSNSIHLYNIYGKYLGSFKNSTIDLSSYDSGIYYIVCKSSKTNYRAFGKVIKQ